MNSIPLEYRIDDIRNISEFSKITITGYQKKQVTDALYSSIISNSIERSCYWAAEIISSGGIDKLWEIFTEIAINNINIGNPLIPGWLYNEYSFYNNYKSKNKNLLEYRNYQYFRNHIAEISCKA